MDKYDVIVEVEYCGGKVQTFHCLNTEARQLVDAQATRTHLYGGEFYITVYGHTSTVFHCKGKRAAHSPRGKHHA